MHIEGGHSHILYLTASCERSTYVLILAHEGRLRRRSRRWSEEWRPAAASRNRSPLGLGTRPPATIRPGCEECAGTIRMFSPVREKRPPGPKSPRWSAERRASPRDAGASHAPWARRKARSAGAAAPAHYLGAPPPLISGARSQKQNPGAKNAPREREGMCVNGSVSR